MKRVEPAPTISPIMYAIRILVIWFFFLGWGLVVEIDCHAFAKVAIYFWCDGATNYRKPFAKTSFGF